MKVLNEAEMLYEQISADGKVVADGVPATNQTVTDSIPEGTTTIRMDFDIRRRYDYCWWC